LIFLFRSPVALSRPQNNVKISGGVSGGGLRGSLGTLGLYYVRAGGDHEGSAGTFPRLFKTKYFHGVTDGSWYISISLYIFIM